jgi:hypothetical protein
VHHFPGYPRPLLFLLVFCSIGHAQNVPMPSSWTPIKFPESSSNDLLCANYSDNEWHLSIDSGELVIAKSARETHTALPKHFTVTKDMSGTPSVAKSDDGWLVGFDGGGLWWVSENGRQSRELIDEHVRAIITRGNDLLVLTGRVTSDEGKAYQYKPGALDGGTLLQIADLGSAPVANLVQDNKTVVIVAQTRVVAIDPSNQMHILLLNNDMNLLYPNSVVADPSGNLFVGMRFYVLRLKHDSGDQYQAQWYVPDRCARTEIRNSLCVCTAH